MQPRPVYLNLFAFKFPVTAIASILHRISGAFLIVLIPYFLVLVDRLQINSNVLVIHNAQQVCSFEIVLWWLGASALVYHFLAGMRHMIMDCGIGENVKAAKISAYGIIIVSAILSMIIGVRLC